MTKELKPCPFCASHNVVLDLDRNKDDDGNVSLWSALVECKKCGARGNILTWDDTEIIEKFLENEAIRSWNMRPENPELLK